jgi:hypothetical protein
MKKYLSNGSLKKSNVARGNWTSPVQTSCPTGLLADCQQDDKIKFYKGFYVCNS